MALAEIDVEVKAKGEAALLVTDGDTEGWVPFGLIDDESDIDETRCAESPSSTTLRSWATCGWVTGKTLVEAIWAAFGD